MQLIAVCLRVLFSCEVEAIPNRYGIETWELVFSSSGSNFDAAFFFADQELMTFPQAEVSLAETAANISLGEGAC